MVTTGFMHEPKPLKRHFKYENSTIVQSRDIQHSYDFFYRFLAKDFLELIPMGSDDKMPWILGKKGEKYLVYTTFNEMITLDLTDHQGYFCGIWFDPNSGKVFKASKNKIQGGRKRFFSPPIVGDSLLFIGREDVETFSERICRF